MKKIEIGTKIKIINAGSGAYGANGKIGIVTNKRSMNGLLPDENGFNVELENGSIWRVSLNGIYKDLSETIEFLDATIKIKGKDTTVVITNDKNEISKGVAVKNEKDCRNDKIGVLIAFARALKIEKEKIDKIINVMFETQEKDLSNFSDLELLIECEKRMKGAKYFG